MKRSIVVKIIASLFLVGVVVSLGIFAYRAGMVQGAGMEPIQWNEGNFPAAPFMHYGHSPMSIGRLFGRLFIFMLVLGAIRSLFWGGPRHWHRMHGHWGVSPTAARGNWNCDIPPVFDEWHRQAHEKESGEAADASNPSEAKTDLNHTIMNPGFLNKEPGSHL